MKPEQKISKMILEYFTIEDKFNQTQSEHWLKARRKMRKDITNEISLSREQSLEQK